MIQFTQITKLVSGWLFEWPDVGQSFSRIVLAGSQIATVTNGPPWTYTWQGFGPYGSFPPPLEVSNSDALVLSELYSPIVTIQWYGENCSQYMIQSSPDGGATWGTVASFQETGSWVYSYVSPILVDEQSYLWQVIALDQYGNAATPRQFTAYVVTPPVPPDVQIAYSYQNPNIVVSPAS